MGRRRRKPRKARSPTNKPRREKVGEANLPTNVVKSPEEKLKRLIFASQALMEPGQFDPKEAARLKIELDELTLAVQLAQQEADSAFFDFLETNIPELVGTKGRPSWIESEQVKIKDKALLDNFAQRQARNVAANAGKKHGASKKTYGDLADEFGDDDPETVKRRVMRARKRQKAQQETFQDILSLVSLGETDGNNAVPPKEYQRRRKKLVKAFRRILKTR